ncbi:hypothetical protein HRbin28_00640 [bacterium HR28]|nr:hypothetical protein HRbin28_00640 [bacterium HR28]
MSKSRPLRRKCGRFSSWGLSGHRERFGKAPMRCIPWLVDVLRWRSVRLPGEAVRREEGPSDEYGARRLAAREY